jgi:hypothetical protein
MIVEAQSVRFKRARAVNTATSGYTAPLGVLSAAQLAAQGGVVVAGPGGNPAAPNARVVFYGVGADGNTATCRLIGYAPIALPTGPTVGAKNGDAHFLATVLWEGNLTFSTLTGQAGMPVLNTENFVDTIATTVGTDGTDVWVVSPANNTPAHLIVDLKGSTHVQVELAVGSATSVNALVGLCG